MSNIYDATTAHSIAARFMSWAYAVGSAVARFPSDFAAARAFSLEVQRLNAKSDAELRSIGLCRSDIPRVVSSRLTAG